GLSGSPELLAAVSSCVGTKLSYVPCSSGPTDGAVQTLLRRQGVCRDYAHLVVALLRALDVPARMAAVYAAGLPPMAGLVRIATGRDAADTAFLSTYGGAATLTRIAVMAVLDGELPGDDVT